MVQDQLSHAPQAVVPVARTSTVDLIAIALRDAIFSGALEVGAQIREIDMARQLGVSRSPLREAMQRLVQERILTAVPGRGLQVSTLGAEHVTDLYLARAAVEGEAARSLAARPNREALDQLEAAYDELQRASESQDARAIGDADSHFHQQLVNLAGSRRLSEYMSTLAVETRIATFSLAAGYAVPASLSPTYRDLLDALAVGDGEGAVQALRTQFDEAVDRFTGERHVDTVEAPPGEGLSRVELVRL